CLLASAQALRIRFTKQEINEANMQGIKKSYDQVFSYYQFLEDDRPLEKDLRKTLEQMRIKFFDV
ncbi:MAG: histidine ammonia-lyase, partial [Treponema sp.]|nr:histidine ammonia-lyase [Treponema sp.]